MARDQSRCEHTPSRREASSWTHRLVDVLRFTMAGIVRVVIFETTRCASYGSLSKFVHGSLREQGTPFSRWAQRAIPPLVIALIHGTRSHTISIGAVSSISTASSSSFSFLFSWLQPFYLQAMWRFQTHGSIWRLPYVFRDGT